MMTGDVVTSLNYLHWNECLDSEKPYQLVSDDLPDLLGIPRQNFEIKPAPKEKIRDARGYASDFNVDDHGFAFLRHRFPELDFENEQQVEEIYKPEIEKLLKLHIKDVDEVCIFNWRLRANRREAKADRLGNIGNPTEVLVPAHFVHTDQTLRTMIDYARENRPDRAEKLLKGRVRIFNVWKPYAVPSVQDCPLALCDGSTVRPQDLIVCDNITKARIGEVVLPLYNANAEWHYLSKQTPDEVTIIKIVDSDDTVKAPCCPHSAFDLPGVDSVVMPRHSIEMRALVFTYADEEGES